MSIDGSIGRYLLDEDSNHLGDHPCAVQARGVVQSSTRAPRHDFHPEISPAYRPLSARERARPTGLLSLEEYRVAELLTKELTPQQIAEKLGKSAKTVQNQIETASKKLPGSGNNHQVRLVNYYARLDGNAST